MNKILIKTGLYSDFAKDVFNDVQKYVQEDRDAATSWNMRCLLAIVVPTGGVQNCRFQHFDDGEVVLCEHPLVSRCANVKNANIELALLLKQMVCRKVGEKAWKRYDFDNKISFYEKSYAVGSLYFIYDFLMNHQQSVNVFKRTYSTVAAEILGSPSDPIASEVKAAIRQKTDEAYARYNNAMKDLKCFFPTFYDDTPAGSELKAKITPIIDAFKAELKLRKAKLKKSLDAELVELEKLKQMQNS